MISVVMDDNIQDIEALIKLSRDMGITYLVTLYSSGRGRRSGKACSPETSERLLALKKKYGNFVALRGYLARFSEAAGNGNTIQPCYAGINLFNIDSCGNVTRCIDSLGTQAGNILTGDLEPILGRLKEFSRSESCGGCWTSCRGAIETLLYGKDAVRNLLDMRAMTRGVPLGGKF
jgi:MoaA/NifB/PqqE/SkfB family radical SAM enzyme